MNRLLPLLLLSLTLLTPACKKDEAKPTPDITGRWNLHRYAVRFYSASGQLLATDSTSLDLKSQYMIVTENTMQYFVDNAPLNPVSTYTRGQDNVLHFDGGRTLDLNTHLVNGRLILDSNGIRVPVSSSPSPRLRRWRWIRPIPANG